MLIIDEAQNLPLPVLEQIRILSNLETDKEKLLQIILVGQLNLQTLLRSPELRQLDQRVSIRYELKPLDGETVGRVRRAPADDRRRIGVGRRSRAKALAAGAPAVGRHPAADQPDLRSRAAGRLLGPQTNRITPEMVTHAAESLDLQPPARVPASDWLKRRRVARPPRPRSCCWRPPWPSASTALLYQRLARRTSLHAPSSAARPRAPSASRRRFRRRPRSSRSPASRRRRADDSGRLLSCRRAPTSAETSRR